MFKKYRLIIILLIAVGISILVACNYAFHDIAEDEPFLLEEVVGRGNIIKEVIAAGILLPSEQVNVGSQVSGQIKKVYVRQGDVVEKGKLLVEIDPVLQENDLKKAQAELKSVLALKKMAEITLKKFQQELTRQEYLQSENAGVLADLENAQAQVFSQLEEISSRSSQIIQAQSNVEAAKANLAFTKITAPISGKVLAIVNMEGQTVAASQTVPTILILANVTTMVVKAKISERDILKINPGQKLWFNVHADPSERYYSNLQSIQTVPNNFIESGGNLNSAIGPVYYDAQFFVDNKSGYLKAAMTTEVHIQTERASNVLRSRTNILQEHNKVQDGKYRVKVKTNGKIYSRIIDVGLIDDQFVEIKSGVIEGDSIVITQHPEA